MDVDDVLTTSSDWTQPLRRPVLLVALRGWFDIADTATDALRWLGRNREAPVVASIASDPFFDFTRERPQVVVGEHDIRSIRWPANDVHIVRSPNRDVLALAGVEPHLRWVTFCECIVTIAQRFCCEIVVTLGAGVDASPHTRSPVVVSSSTTPQLVRTLGLARPRYEGPTGVVGVLQARLEREAIPAISLRVGVPHYLANARHPRSSAALLDHLGHVLAIPTGAGELQADVDEWREHHDAAVASDPDATAYVRMLEAEYDRSAEKVVPSSDDLSVQLDQFLRDLDGGTS